MNIEKTGKPDRWSKGFKKKLLCELEELGGDFDRVARLNGVEVSQLQRWQKRYEGEANNMAPSFLSVEVAAKEKALPNSSSSQSNFFLKPLLQRSGLPVFPVFIM